MMNNTWLTADKPSEEEPKVPADIESSVEEDDDEDDFDDDDDDEDEEDEDDTVVD